MKQLEMKLPMWGGKRDGAGRKPKGETAGVSHEHRPKFPARHPVHVTMRLLWAAGFLRAFSRRRAIEDAIRAAQERFGMRVVHYSIQGNHLHFILEADEPAAFSRAVQGLAIRIARSLNRIARRTGKVFADRFHMHVLGTLQEVGYAVRYVLENFRHHLREDGGAARRGSVLVRCRGSAGELSSNVVAPRGPVLADRLPDPALHGMLLNAATPP